MADNIIDERELFKRQRDIATFERFAVAAAERGDDEAAAPALHYARKLAT